jgi:hypothetical protein
MLPITLFIQSTTGLLAFLLALCMAVIPTNKHKSVYVIQASINTRDWAPPAPMSAHRIIDEFKIVMFTVSLEMGFAMGVRFTWHRNDFSYRLSVVAFRCRL